MNEKLVPKLRFNGFNDEWATFKLGEIITLMQSGLSRQLSVEDIGVPVLRSNNIVNGQFDVSDIKFWYLIDTKGSRTENYFLKKDDLLVNFINSLGKMGKSAVYNDELKRPTIFTTNLMRLNFKKDIDTYFIYYFFNTTYYKNYIDKITKPAVNQASFTTKDFKKMELKIPTMHEQFKISKFLKHIDKKIELLENKLEYYQDFKKYLMQQIFTQKLRFDENCQYKTKKVKDFLVESKIEGTDDISKRLTVKLNLKGITIRESKTIEIEGATKQFIRKSGQFIYGKQNLHKGAFGIVPKELDGYLTSSDIPSFDFKGEIEPKWFYYYFSRKSFYEKLENLSTGTGSKRISPKEFLNIKIIVPEIEEQQRIVYLLAKIDEKINQNGDQILQMNKFKKSLLQQMFI